MDRISCKVQLRVAVSSWQTGCPGRLGVADPTSRQLRSDPDAAAQIQVHVNAVSISVPVSAATRSMCSQRGKVHVTPASLSMFAKRVIEGYQHDDYLKYVDENKFRRKHDLWWHEGAIGVLKIESFRTETLQSFMQLHTMGKLA